ncbi:MAG: DUF5666 domain-containing protein [Actinomycetota bacterium]|nr:DUF5666 domain-containing protein [Actinomycetota bacterium]
MKQLPPSVGGNRLERRRRLGLRAAAATTVLSGALGGGVAYAATSGGASATAGALSASARSSGAWLSAPGRTAPAVIGTVSAVNAAANTFSVKNAAGSTYTINVSSSTTYREHGDSSASLSKLSVGDHVAVIGTASGTTVSATAVLIGMGDGLGPFGHPGGPFGAAPAVIGTVSAVNAAANTFSVKNAAGSTYTINVSSSTTYREHGDSSASLSKLSVGDHVAVIGTASGTTVSATAVLIGMGDGLHGGGWNGGMRQGPGWQGQLS